MRFLSTRTHGILDYIMGALLIAAPSLLGFAYDGPALWVPVILGLAVILYSMQTNYERGLVPVISMRGHLVLDFLGGLVLATSPWLFGFAPYVWAPHVILGIAEICASLMTQRVPIHGPGRRQTAITHHP